MYLYHCYYEVVRHTGSVIKQVSTTISKVALIKTEDEFKELVTMLAFEHTAQDNNIIIKSLTLLNP